MDCGLAVVLSKFLDNQFSSGTTFVAELIEADLPGMVCVCWDGNEASVRGRGTMAGVGVQRGAVCGASDRCSTVRCTTYRAAPWKRLLQSLGLYTRIRWLVRLQTLRIRPSECDDVIKRAHVSRSRGLPHREVTDGLRRPPF